MLINEDQFNYLFHLFHQGVDYELYLDTQSHHKNSTVEHKKSHSKRTRDQYNM